MTELEAHRSMPHSVLWGSWLKHKFSALKRLGLELMLDLGVILGDQKIEQQTSECFYEDTWRKPVMEGNGLPEVISQNWCLCHTTGVYIGSANKFILSTLWWPHSGQSWCISQSTASVLDVPLSDCILTPDLLSFYMNKWAADLPKLYPLGRCSYYFCLLRLLWDEQRNDRYPCLPSVHTQS